MHITLLSYLLEKSLSVVLGKDLKSFEKRESLILEPKKSDNPKGEKNLALNENDFKLYKSE
jgi:hypothetical protein